MAHKILIVDDEQDIVTVLHAALQKKGYDVCDAADGFEALQKVGVEKPDLILLDIMMPKLDGYSVNFRLKENPETAKIPVIVITGRGNMQEFLKVRDDLTVAAYLEKPFTVVMLLEKIHEILHD